jgi:hypothetical protein
VALDGDLDAHCISSIGSGRFVPLWLWRSQGSGRATCKEAEEESCRRRSRSRRTRHHQRLLRRTTPPGRDTKAFPAEPSHHLREGGAVPPNFEEMAHNPDPPAGRSSACRCKRRALAVDQNLQRHRVARPRFAVEMHQDCATAHRTLHRSGDVAIRARFRCWRDDSCR